MAQVSDQARQAAKPMLRSMSLPTDMVGRSISIAFATNTQEVGKLKDIVVKDCYVDRSDGVENLVLLFDTQEILGAKVSTVAVNTASRRSAWYLNAILPEKNGKPQTASWQAVYNVS